MRGGYGISYLPSNTGLLAGPFVISMFPWGVGTTSLPFGANPQGVVVGLVEDPAASPILLAVGANQSSPQNYGNSPNTFPRNNLNGLAQQWNVFFEKKVSSWLFSIGYVGSHGNNLPVNRVPINGENLLLPANIQTCYHAGLNCPANDSAVAAAGGFLGTGVDPYSQSVTNPFNPTGSLPFTGTLRQATIPRGILDGPFPLFYGQTVPASDGYSSYNALQVQAKHQVGHGLILDASYTWSKELDYSSFEAENNVVRDTDLNAYNGPNLFHIRANRKLGSNDMPHRFVASLVYALPFGAGHSLNPQNRISRALVSGWGIAAVEMDQSGYPIDITGDSSGSLDGRSNRTTEPLQVPKALQHWYDGKTSVTLPDGNVITPAAYTFLKYNVGAFTSPVIVNPTNSAKYLNDTYWMGTQAVDYGGMRAPMINNLNFTLKRSFRVSDRIGIDFQADATNVLNHPNFETYTSALGSAELTPSNSTNTPLGVATGSSTYGTHSNLTFDSRQIELQMRLRF